MILILFAKIRSVKRSELRRVLGGGREEKSTLSRVACGSDEVAFFGVFVVGIGDKVCWRVERVLQDRQINLGGLLCQHSVG